MRLLVTLLSAWALYKGTGSTLNERIYGGINARNGDVPWQAILIYYIDGRANRCGGSIINDRWIVTAGHCVSKFNSSQIYLVGVGIIDLREMEKKENRRIIQRVFIHPDLDGPYNDLALIKMNEKIEFNDKVNSIAMPEPGTSFEGHICIASGWGESDKADKDKLLMVPLQVGTDAACKKSWDKYYSIKTQICAGESRHKQSVCNGDTGGPLACHVDLTYYLAGVSSFGGVTCPNIVPDVFSRISYFKKWIDDKIYWNS